MALRSDDGVPIGDYMANTLGNLKVNPGASCARITESLALRACLRAVTLFSRIPAFKLPVEGRFGISF